MLDGLVQDPHLGAPRQCLADADETFSVQAPDAVGYALAAMEAAGAAVVQGHCAVRNVHAGLLPGGLAAPYMVGVCG